MIIINFLPSDTSTVCGAFQDNNMEAEKGNFVRFRILWWPRGSLRVRVMHPGPGLRIQRVRSPEPGIYGSGLRIHRVRIPGSMAPDSAISNTGARTNLKSRTPDSGLYNTGLRAMKLL